MYKMSRNVAEVDIDKLEMRTDIRSGFVSQNKSNPARGGTNAKSNCDVYEANQKGKGILPNVNVLIKNHAHLDGHSDKTAVTTDVCNDSSAICCKTINRFGEGGQHFLNMDVDEKHYYRTRVLCPVHSGDIQCQDCGECGTHLNLSVLKSESFTDASAPDTAHPVSALVCSELSHQALEQYCENRRNFVPISHIPSSVRRIQSHMTVIMPNDGRDDTSTTASSKSPDGYMYQNHLSMWEQENDKCVDYTWRNDVYSGRAFSDGNIMGSSNGNTFPSNNGIVNNQVNADDRYSKIYLSEGSCARISVSNSRRRRKRVQTPGQRTAANMRERRRMCHLNVAFDRLKERLPNIKNKQKLSRIQTLKAAIDYIHFLKDSLSLC